MYTTTIFGASETTLLEVMNNTSENTCNLIDEFSGENDGIYKETGHIKPYPHLFDLMTSYSTAKNLSKEDRPTIINNIITFVFIALFIGLKIFSPILPNKVILPLASLSRNFLDPIIGLEANNIVFNQLAASYLGIKFPAKVAIWDDREEIAIIEQSCNGIRKMETRSLSNMQFKKIIPANNPLQKHFPRRQNLVERKNGRTYVLNKNKVDIYLANDDYEPPKDKNNSPQPKHDYQSKDKLSSLPTTDVISFSASKNRDLIVAVDKNSVVHKLELQRREPLHKIIKSYRSFLQKKEKLLHLVCQPLSH